MPHQNLPENWVDSVLYSIVTAVAGAALWFGRLVFGLNQRVTALEHQNLVSDERHESNIERLDRIEAKLDRLIERRP